MGLRGDARSGIGLAALAGDPQVLQRALFALNAGGEVHELLGLARGAHDGVVLAVQLDAEARHRLAGLGDAVDDALRPQFLDADDDDRGDVGIRAGADEGAEVQVEVGAELQPAVGMRQGHGALDVVRDGFGRGIGEVVKRQDDDMIAHADASVFPPVTPESRFAQIDRQGVFSVLPPFGLDVVHMQVLAGLDGRDDAADIDAVLDHGGAGIERLDGELVTDGDITEGLNADGLILIHDPAGEGVSFFDALDDDDPDRVALVVDHEMNAHRFSPI